MKTFPSRLKRLEDIINKKYCSLFGFLRR